MVTHIAPTGLARRSLGQTDRDHARREARSLLLPQARGGTALVEPTPAPKPPAPVASQPAVASPTAPPSHRTSRRISTRDEATARSTCSFTPTTRCSLWTRTAPIRCLSARIRSRASSAGRVATKRRGLPITDVAETGGWDDIRALLTCYQLADPDTMRRVADFVD